MRSVDVRVAVRRVVSWSVSTAAAMLMIGALLGSPPAFAHTDVESVEPADGSVLADPSGDVVIVFKKAVTGTSSGFEVLSATGDLLVPRVLTDDGRRHVLRFDAPLPDGEVAVRYEVRAEDGHTISGGFRFTVVASSASASVPTSAPTIVHDMSMDGMSMDGMSMDGMSMDGMVDASDDSSLTDLPMAVYPTLGVAAVGGVVAANRLRARR